MKRFLALFFVMAIVAAGFTLVASAAELENVAQGKKYTLNIGSGKPGYGGEDIKGHGDGTDVAFQKLTDGRIATTDLNDGISGAQETTKAIYTIDLGEVVNGITKFNMDLIAIPSWGVLDYTDVEYEISTDNVNFTSVGKVDKANAVAKAQLDPAYVGHDFILTLTNAVSARYVRITAQAGNYIWSTEMQVFADTSAPAETSSETSSEINSAANSDVDSTVSAAVSSNSSVTSENPETNDHTGEYIAIAAVVIILSGIAIGYVVKKKA